MKLKGLINTNYIGWFVVIAVIIFLYLFYFFSYIPQQEALLQERSFRILKEYSNNMQGKYDYYRTHLDNFGDYYIIRYNLENNGSNSLIKRTERFKYYFPRINEVIKDLEKTISAEPNDSTLIFRYDGYEHLPVLIFKSKSKNGDANLKPVITKWSYISGKGSQFYQDLEFKVPISTFMEGLKFDQLLENIELFDDSAVVYNTNLEVVHDITNPGALADSMQFHQGGMTKILHVRGQEKRLMILPIDFVGKRFYLAGIISNAEFKKKTHAINTQLLIIVSGLLLLILIGMPVLKIIFIDPRDRMAAGDSHRAAMSMIFGTSIVVLITIGLLNHQLADKKIQQRRMKNISDRIYRNINSDFRAIVSFYKEIIGEDSVKKDTDSLKLSPFVQAKLKSGKVNFVQIPDSLTYPFPLNEVILMDTTGIVKRAVTRTAFSDAVEVNVSGRKYFQNVVDSTKSWLLKDENEWFYIESIKSYNTGKQETAVSFNLRKRMNDSLKVLAITSVIPTLYNQVVPEDAEFVIINDSGDVLFHSIRSKNLHENFLDECSLNPRLVSAMKLRLEENTQIEYNEKPWLANIKPINDTPLYLVTLIDLQQSQNRNTRIFLFTFYFMVVSFICVIIGMLIVRLSKPQNEYMESESWLLNWLLFQPRNYMRYKAFLFVLGVILVCQVAGVFIIDNPVKMLLYQLMFIVLTGFVSLFVLGQSNFKVHQINKKENLPALLILIIFLVLAALLIRIHFHWSLLIPFIGILLVAAFVVYSVENSLLAFPENFSDIKTMPLVPFRLGEKKSKSVSKDKEFHPGNIPTRNLYNLCMFFWLVSLSVLPVLGYYLSVQHQEKLLWRREQMSQIAYKNLVLAKNFGKMRTATWFERLQGNGIENMKITYCDSCRVDSVKRDSSFTNWIYSLLSDPVTKGDYQMTYLTNRSYQDEWNLEDTKLEYSSTGIKGTVTVTSKDGKGAGIWIEMLILILLAGVLLIIWFVLSYVTEYILCTKQEKWENPEPEKLDKLLKDEKLNRLLINTFNERQLLEETHAYIKSANKERNKKQELKLEILDAGEITDFGYLNVEDYTGNNQMVLVSGLDQCIGQIKTHSLVLTVLMELNRKVKGKLIVSVPFEIDYIFELYEDYLAENESDKSEKYKLFALQRDWENAFKDFHKFYIPALKNDTQSATSSQTEEELFNVFIWNNLCRTEKLVLYDLAEDGLMNLKNKQLIKQLMNKGLIVSDNYLKIWSDDFKDFINTTIKTEEVKELESKLTFKGMWRSMRNPIIIILVIIAAFIFISQGYSVEKVTAIFAGILTLLAGMVRLFESSLFR